MIKLTWDDLIIENTRKCNMTPICAHCMRGDPQHLDIPFEAIDNLISQTAMIERLRYIGGEPFININAMEYILLKIMENNIPLYDLEITTNGIANIDMIKTIIIKYSNYIKHCRANPFDRFRVTTSKEEYVTLVVSQDEYHGHKNLVESNIIDYKRELQYSHYANVIIAYTGAVPFFTGRARKYVPFDKTIFSKNNVLDSCEERRIELLDQTHKPICRYYKTYKLMYPDQVIIVCPVAVCATGKMVHGNVNLTADYDKMDNPHNIVSDINNSADIYADILNYNQSRRICMDIESSMANIYHAMMDEIMAHNARTLVHCGYDAVNKMSKKYIGNLISTNIDDATDEEKKALDYKTNLSLIDRKEIISRLKERCEKYNYDRYAIERKPSNQSYAEYKKQQSKERANSPRLQAIREKLLS